MSLFHVALFHVAPYSRVSRIASAYSVLIAMAGADNQHDGQWRGRSRLSPPLEIPKTRSTASLGGLPGDKSEKAHIRFSFDAGVAAAGFDNLARLVPPVSRPRRKGDPTWLSQYLGSRRGASLRAVQQLVSAPRVMLTLPRA